MTYGITIYNDNNELIIDENYVCPSYMGKLTLTLATAGVNGGESGYLGDLYNTTYTGQTITGDTMIFWTIPESIDDNVYFGYFPQSFICASSYSGKIVAYRPTGGGSYNLPEGYVFQVAGVPATSDTFGLRVFKADGSVAFDSGYKPLQIQSLIGLFAQTTSTTPVSTALGTLPSVPGFFMSGFSKETWALRSGGSGLSDGVLRNCGVRRNGSTVYTRGFIVGSGTEDSTINGSIEFGSVAGSMPIIDVNQYSSTFYLPTHSAFSYSDYYSVNVNDIRAKFTRSGVDGRFDEANPGARVRFVTSSRYIRVCLNYSNKLTTTIFYNGWGAVLVDGSFYINFNRAYGEEGNLYLDLDLGSTASKTVEILMPWCASVEFMGVNVPNGYNLTSAAARSSTRCVIMGDSITQGFDSSQIATSWGHLLAQSKNWQVINHGYGGRPCIPSDGTVLGNLSPSVAVYMIGYNDFNTQVPLATFKANYISFINNFRAINTTTKLYCLTPIYSPNTNTLTLENYRTQIRDALTSLGNSLNVLVEGASLMTNSNSRLTDTIHPNDTGCSEIASALNGIVFV